MNLRVVALAAAVVLLSGCAAAPDPLQLDQGVTGCFDSDLYTEGIVGLGITNPADEDARLEAISFTTLDDLTVLDVWLIDADPQADGTTLGYGMEAYPPDVETRPSWDDRVDAEGATLPGGHSSFLVIHIERSSAEATFRGVAVAYRIGDTEYTATSDNAAGFSAAGDCT